LPALPESFDMGKRLGLFVYFATRVDRDSSFSKLAGFFAKDYTIIKTKMASYRSGCMNISALKKARTGLPSPNSLTSIDKVLRMAHGFGLFKYDYHSPSRSINPVDKTFLLKSCFKRFLPISFELARPTKFILAELLLMQDSDLTLPLLRILRNKALSTEASRTDLLRDYAEACVHRMELVLKEAALSEAEVNTAFKRLRFFESNFEQLEAGGKPSRGLLHMLDPRLHWLIDLLLVDFHAFCEHGMLSTVSLFPDSVFESPIVEKTETESIITHYSYYLRKLPLDDFNEGLVSMPPTNEHTSEGLLKHSIASLAPMFGRLIPIDVVVDRAWSVALSIMKKPPSRSLLNETIYEIGYPTYRDWRSGSGYLEVRRKNTDTGLSG